LKGEQEDVEYLKQECLDLKLSYESNLSHQLGIITGLILAKSSDLRDQVTVQSEYVFLSNNFS